MNNINKIKTILSLLLSIFLVSCSYTHAPKNNLTEDPPSDHVDDRIARIYEIVDVNGVMGNYRNPITASNQSTKEDVGVTSKIVSLGTRDVNACYKETILWSIGDTKTHIYEFENGHVGYRDDGSLYTVYDKTALFTLDLNKISTIDELDDILRSATRKWVDLSDFELYNTTTDEILDDRIGVASAQYAKIVNGFIVDLTTILIDGDGTVDVIMGQETKITGVEQLKLLLAVDEKYEKEVITLKLKDMFENENRTLASKDYTVSDKVAYMYNGELCILYNNINVEVTYQGEDRKSVVGCNILVPVSVLVS